MEFKQTLVAMMGLPRSGKSTAVQALMQQTGAPVVCRDNIRLALHGQRFQAKAEPMVKAISIYMIKALFMSGHTIVIADETNYSKAARNSLKGDWDVVFYPILTDKDVCIQRAKDSGQEDLIPVIEEMAARYEPLDENDFLLSDANVVIANGISRVMGIQAVRKGQIIMPETEILTPTGGLISG